jgi:RNA 2',3'-cyclic 3'-phosphodiesterase
MVPPGMMWQAAETSRVTGEASSKDASARLRLFVAVELPPAWREYLAARAQQLERLAPGYARWVAPELLHLTLLFLGEQPTDRLPAIEAATASAAASSRAFTLPLGRLGHFGGAVPRVLWVEATAQGDHLVRLHAALCEQLTARSIAYGAKPLVAHLTLGRARRDATPAAGRALTQRLGTLTVPAPPAPYRVETITLMRSELSARGPRYTAVGTYPLGAAPSA